MGNCYFILLIGLTTFSQAAFAQSDSSMAALQQVPTKYLKIIDAKIDRYTQQISGKTKRTLTKLARWEEKIKTALEKTSPETASKLFSNGQLTFGALLQKIEQGEQTALEYHQQYDKYRDDLTTNISYLERHKQFLDTGVAVKIAAAKEKISVLNNIADSTEAIQQFIRERKKKLIDEAIVLLGKNKYLKKINAETYYYTQALKNYKDVLNDSKKTEALVASALQSIPSFKDFFKKNSMLSSLFGSGIGSGQQPSLEGLQTRAQVSSFLQTQLTAGGPGAQQTLEQNLQVAKEQLNTIKNKVANLGVGGADVDDRLGNFKPNNQRTKTFLQRIETGFNFQSQGANTYFPTTTDIAVTAAYKLNDKASIGLGTSYKFGWGQSITNIKLTTEGAGLRSFAEYKLKGSFYAGAGFEYNYQPPAAEMYGLKKTTAWSQSGLAGISKIISAKSNFYKKTKIQLFWDFLSYSQLPRTAPVKFRIGYVL